MGIRRRNLLLAVLVVCVGTVTVASWSLINSKHYWARRSIEVVRDGIPLPGATSYRSKDGVYLIYLSSEDMVYSFYPESSSMGVCGLYHYIDLYIGLVLWDEQAACVGFNPVKARDPELVVHGDHFIFTSMRGNRIEVSWYGP